MKKAELKKIAEKHEYKIIKFDYYNHPGKIIIYTDELIPELDDYIEEIEKNPALGVTVWVERGPAALSCYGKLYKIEYAVTCHKNWFDYLNGGWK